MDDELMKELIHSDALCEKLQVATERHVFFFVASRQLNLAVVFQPTVTVGPKVLVA